jgi:diadenylate cyclase
LIIFEKKYRIIMIPVFITIRIIDIIDILLVAFIMYQVYVLIKGTVAFSIFIGVIGIYLLYVIVDLLKMKLLSSILGAVIGGGAIALIVLFQQEIRRFLIFLGSKYFPNRKFSLENIFNTGEDIPEKVRIDSIHKACINMAKSNTGALIVIARSSSLSLYADTGDILNASTSSRLLESIFIKNSPLHDGAVIIENEKIISARSVLPFSDKTELPPSYGMRHRAALGISENTDAFVIIISEETGEISVAEEGRLSTIENELDLMEILKRNFEN